MIGVRRLGNVASRQAFMTRRMFHGSVVNRFAAEDVAEATALKLRLASPTMAVKSDVALVNLPGMTGEFGATPNHAPTLSELRSGPVSVFEKEGSDPQTYFVSGGYALIHPDSSADVSVADLVSLEDLDASVASKNLADARKRLEGATEETPEHATAQIEVEVYEAVCVALGQQV